MSALVTFADFAALPGVGVTWYVNVSLDHFATQFKNYSMMAMPPLGGGAVYDPRIISIGNLTHAFGSTPGFTASTVSLELENLDGGCDWLVDRSTFASQSVRAKFELYCILYVPSDFTQRSVKQVGTFMLMDPPMRGAESITLSLVDDVLGDVASLAPTPTLNDWIAITDPARPLFLTGEDFDQSKGSDAGGLIEGLDYDAPFPLMFGKSAMRPTRVGLDTYVVCAVAGSPAGLPDDIYAVRSGDGGNIPSSIGSSPRIDFWKVHRTPVILKGDRYFHLLWFELYAITLLPYLRDRGLIPDGYKTTTNGIHDLIAPVYILANLLSHPVDEFTVASPIPGIVIVQDLLTYYARRLNAPLDTASFSAVRAARPNSPAAGVVEQGVSISTNDSNVAFHELTDGAMVTAIRDIASMCGFDVFVDWSGTIRATALVSDYDAQTASFATLDETLVMPDVKDKIPAVGERNAPYNRTFVTIRGKRYGPVDDAVAIADWGKVVPRQFNGDWLPLGTEYNSNLLGASGGLLDVRPAIKTSAFGRLGGSIVRPVVTCRTWLNGLSFELGDYIYFTWRRGGVGGPYINSTFRVEAITVDPMGCTVELQLLWVDDLRSTDNLPYLLDNETLNTRCTGSGGRTATATVASTTVNFSSGNLVSDGVVVGDNLILRDATEGESSFNRNQVFRITAVATTSVTIASAIAGTGGPFVLSTWEIQASALTYRANATYFGKTVDSTGVFSNAVIGNKLLEG